MSEAGRANPCDCVQVRLKHPQYRAAKSTRQTCAPHRHRMKGPLITFSAFASGFCACVRLLAFADARTRRQRYPTVLSSAGIRAALRDFERGVSVRWPAEEFERELVRRIEATQR